jgi:hypothetical protein
MKDQLRHSWWGLILAEHDTEPTELAGGLMKLVLGSQLILPLDTFATSATFRDLTVLPEWAWGALLIVIGVGHLAALRNGNRSWRRWGSGVGFLLWFSLGATFLHASPNSLGAWVFLLAAVGQMWCYVRLGGPA